LILVMLYQSACPCIVVYVFARKDGDESRTGKKNLPPMEKNREIFALYPPLSLSTLGRHEFFGRRLIN